MNEEIVKNAIICLSNMEIEDTTYQVARDIVIQELKLTKEENDTLKKTIITLEKSKFNTQKERDDYLNRIKEATKLIKKQKVYLNDSINLHKKDLMNILKGKKEINKK